MHHTLYKQLHTVCWQLAAAKLGSMQSNALQNNGGCSQCRLCQFNATISQAPTVNAAPHCECHAVLPA